MLPNWEGHIEFITGRVQRPISTTLHDSRGWDAAERTSEVAVLRNRE